jgi:hypothetical protein
LNSQKPLFKITGTSLRNFAPDLDEVHGVAPCCAEPDLSVVVWSIPVTLDGELKGFLHFPTGSLPRTEIAYLSDLTRPAVLQSKDAAAFSSQVLGLLRLARHDVPLRNLP